MDDAPRGGIKALAMVAGLLISVGAGCARATKNENVVSQNVSGIQFDRLVPENTGDRIHVKGIDMVCDKENAKILFANDLDWNSVEQSLAAKEKDGWKNTIFCFDRNHMTAAFVLEKDVTDSKGNVHHQIVLGASGSEVTNTSPVYSEPIDNPSIPPPAWTVRFQKKSATAETVGSDLGSEWQATYTLTYHDSGGKYALKESECTLQRFELPPGLKINLPKNCTK